jgi:hypothetical protein
MIIKFGRRRLTGVVPENAFELLGPRGGVGVNDVQFELVGLCLVLEHAGDRHACLRIYLGWAPVNPPVAEDFSPQADAARQRGTKSRYLHMVSDIHPVAVGSACVVPMVRFALEAGDHADVRDPFGEDDPFGEVLP